MKRRTKVIAVLACVALAGLMALCFWRGSEPAYEPVSRVEKKGAEGTVGVPRGSEAKRDKTPSKRQLPLLNESDLEQKYGTEAIFFGKVVDLNGDPVPNAEIRSTRSGKLDEDPGLVPSWLTKSAADGTFNVRQAQAPDLDVAVTPPPGYYGTKESQIRHFNFYEPPTSILSRMSPREVQSNRAHKADPNNPVIFTLRKMGLTEPMIHRQKSAVVSADQDFLIGRDDSHKVHLKYWLDPEVKRIEKPSERSIYEWGFELSVAEGGIVARGNPEATDSQSFIAPAGGYEPASVTQFTSQMDAKTYSHIAKKEYFLCFSDGTHARVAIDIGADPKRPFIVIDSWFNPAAGSRATEFDSSKQIEVQPEVKGSMDAIRRSRPTSESGPKPQ